MKKINIFLASALLIISIVFGAAGWFFYFNGKSYDNDIREISLKLDFLAQEELGKDTTINELQEKINLITSELSSLLTKIPSGKDDEEAIIRLYFSTSLDYMKSKSRWLDAMMKKSALSEKVKDPNSFSEHCSSYSNPMSMGSCMMNAAVEMEKAFASYQAANLTYNSTIASERTALIAVVEAKKNANSIASKSAVVATPSFDELVSKILID